MILNMKKYLFIGAKGDLAEFFLRAQEEGCIEFLTRKGKQAQELPPSIAKLKEAIKILSKLPPKEAYKKGGDLEYADEVASQVLDLTHEMEKLSEEKRFIEAEIIRVAPFGNFSFDDIAYIEKVAKKKVQFYCVKTSKAHEVEDANSLIYVGTDYDLDYFIGIHDTPKSFPKMIEVHFDKTVGELKNHLAFVGETLHQVEAELKGFASHLEFLREAKLEQLDDHVLEIMYSQVEEPIEGSLFSIEGWVPEDKVEKLPTLLEGSAIHYELIVKEKKDKIPTYMKNEQFNKVGEDLVKVYDVPDSTDKDPSGWVIWAFTLFFSIIVADGGYGLLFLLLAFFLKKKFPNLKGAAKRFVKLLFLLATGCIVWGVLTTSFFGIVINPANPINKISILNLAAEKKAEFHKEANDKTHQEWEKKFPQIASAQTGKEMLSVAYVEKNGIRKYEMLDAYTDNILLELSLLIGVIHISISLLRYVKRSWANAGWVAFAVGGYLYFPLSLKASTMLEFLGGIPMSTLGMIGLQILYFGLGSTVVLALIQKRLKGVGEIAQVITVFVDILSYLRLYALALASTIMARTFNEMGLKFGLVLGAVVIFIGHCMNIVLATMGGVIHGLRLNFIEWYHFCFVGEGRLFNPLRKLKKVKQE